VNDFLSDALNDYGVITNGSDALIFSQNFALEVELSQRVDLLEVHQTDRNPNSLLKFKRHRVLISIFITLRHFVSPHPSQVAINLQYFTRPCLVSTFETHKIMISLASWVSPQKRHHHETQEVAEIW
jgi:hypothetical protein